MLLWLQRNTLNWIKDLLESHMFCFCCSRLQRNLQTFQIQLAWFPLGSPSHLRIFSPFDQCSALSVDFSVYQLHFLLVRSCVYDTPLYILAYLCSVSQFTKHGLYYWYWKKKNKCNTGHLFFWTNYKFVYSMLSKTCLE